MNDEPKIEVLYGYSVLRPELQVVFIPPTRWERFVGTCWDAWYALVQIALYAGLIMSLAIVIRFATR